MLHKACSQRQKLTFEISAWTVDKHVPIYGPVISLVLAGISAIWVYACVLAYIVDSATGMASTAVSCNSLFRGLIGFAASQAGEPILTSAGNGPLYTGWAILLLIAEVALILVIYKGQQWKENTARKKAEKEGRKWMRWLLMIEKMMTVQ